MFDGHPRSGQGWPEVEQEVSLEKTPVIVCTLDYLDISSIRDSWGGYASIAMPLNIQKIVFAIIPDQPRARIWIVEFHAIVTTKDVTEYASRQQMRVAGPEWLPIVNAGCSFPGRPMVALASPAGLNSGASLYSRRCDAGVELSLAWGQ